MDGLVTRMSTANNRTSLMGISTPWHIQQQSRRTRMGPLRSFGKVEWDPEGLLGRAQGGHIARRQRERLMKENREFAEQMAKMQSEAEREIWAKREARILPETDEDLVEFFLNTEMEEMSFEVARCRPKLTPNFFKYLDRLIGSERFGPNPDKESLAELETLRDYLQEAVGAVDETAKQTSSAVHKMKKLLISKDKKATILEMVANNEIDKPLMDLLQQNLDEAREAGEEAKAEFMGKIHEACSRYFIPTAGRSVETEVKQ